MRTCTTILLLLFATGCFSADGPDCASQYHASLVREKRHADSLYSEAAARKDTLAIKALKERTLQLDEEIYHARNDR